MKVVFDIDGTLSNPGHRLHFIQPKGEDCSVCDSWGGNLPGARVHDRDHTRSGSCTYAKKDWDGFFAACGDDTPIPINVKLCQELMLAGHTLEFWTGRREAERDTTVEWLNKHVVTREICLNLLAPLYEYEGITLKMRKDGDRRPDYVLKMEFIDWNHPPDIIFEDRSRVVKAYRELGLTVFQVAEGDF